MTERKKPSRILILLGEYLGFSVLCGWVCMLFFLWTSKLLSDHYALENAVDITPGTEYILQLLCISAGVFIGAFILILLLQKKFSYIVQISRVVEEMESGNLSQQIPILGTDELSDLAASINHLTKAWNAQLDQSVQMNEERMQTIATLSHDLRTPLTSVMSYLQLISDRQYTNDDQLHLYAERAYKKAVRIKEMSDSLFNSCISHPNITGAREKIEGSSHLRMLLEEAKTMLINSGFQVNMVDCVNNCLFNLIIDRSGMYRLFDNMLSNIEKYADPRYPVEFHAELLSGKLILRQRNYVLEVHRRKNVESHLLGLKSVKQQLLEMGGSLVVTEENDIFSIEIQLAIC